MKDVRTQDSKAARNKKKKKEALFNTAFDLFTDKGIQNTSISNIAEKAGIGKGTFYLYFKDKYDIRNRLIAHKSSQIFQKAQHAMLEKDLTNLEDKIVFLADHIIGQFTEDKRLLKFIAKDLSWGVFKTQIFMLQETDDVNFSQLFEESIRTSKVKYENPEVMLFLIIEMLGSSCYNSIIYQDPLPIEALKPYLFRSIRAVMRSFEVKA